VSLVYIVRDVEGKQKDDKGQTSSKGYGFVEFAEHAHALAYLRELNNNSHYAEEYAVNGARVAKMMAGGKRPPPGPARWRQPPYLPMSRRVPILPRPPPLVPLPPLPFARSEPRRPRPYPSFPRNPSRRPCRPPPSSLRGPPRQRTRRTRPLPPTNGAPPTGMRKKLGSLRHIHGVAAALDAATVLRRPRAPVCAEEITSGAYEGAAVLTRAQCT